MFKPIHGWDDTHTINKSGEVIVKKRFIVRKDGHLTTLKEHFLKWNLQKGYPTVALVANGRTKRYFIHRLVFETFVKKIPEGMQINHINGIKVDNRIENLELVTPKENTEHAWRTGLSKKQLGEKCSTSKLNNKVSLTQLTLGI